MLLISVLLLLRVVRGFNYDVPMSWASISMAKGLGASVSTCLSTTPRLDTDDHLLELFLDVGAIFRECRVTWPISVLQTG